MIGFFKNPFFRFIFLGLGLYLLWQFTYELVIHPWGYLDRVIIDNLVFFSSEILEILGYDTIPKQDPSITTRIAGVDGSTGVWVGDACNGLTLFMLFIIFVIAYPGSWKSRLWFLPIGLLTIHGLNILRITALALIQYYSPEMLEFNHNYTFTILVYSWVFLLWYLWTTKYSKRGKNVLQSV